MTSEDSALSGLVRAFRERLHLTQDELATRAGVSVRSVRRIENGQRVAAETLRSVAAAMGVDADTLPERPLPAVLDLPTGTVSFVDAAVRKEIVATGERILSEERPSWVASTAGGEEFYARYQSARKVEARSWGVSFGKIMGGVLVFSVSGAGIADFCQHHKAFLSLDAMEHPVGLAAAAGVALGLSFLALGMKEMRRFTSPSWGYIEQHGDLASMRYILTDKALWVVKVGPAGFVYRRLPRDLVAITGSRTGNLGIEQTLVSAGSEEATLHAMPKDGAIARLLAGHAGEDAEAAVRQTA